MIARPLPHQHPLRCGGHLVAWALLIVTLGWTVDHLAQPASSQNSGADHAAGAVPAASRRALAAVAYAHAQLGKPYRWGAQGPGAFDCSGLTWAAWHHAGLGWRRMTAADQWHTLRAHEVPRAQLRPGDLVFFARRLGDWRSIHHVGLYVGRGLMVEAPRRGAAVRLASINRGGWFAAVRPQGDAR
jgi:cell wall-associated NlpC family hydrolase